MLLHIHLSKKAKVFCVHFYQKKKIKRKKYESYLGRKKYPSPIHCFSHGLRGKGFFDSSRSFCGGGRSGRRENDADGNRGRIKRGRVRMPRGGIGP